MKKIFLIIAVLIFINSSCSKSNGSDKFLGTWKDLKSSSTFTIKKVGQNFSISNESGTYPASYNKDQDKLELKAGMRQFDFIYDPKTKHIIVDGSEAEKINN